MLKQIIDLLPVRVFWKDLNSNYLGCNKIFAQDAGLNTPEEVMGKNGQQFYWGEHAVRYKQVDDEVIRTGRSKLNYIEKLASENGSIHWVKTSKAPLTDSKGNIRGVLGMYQDITEKKKMEEDLKQSLGEFRLFFEQDLTGNFVSSTDGKLLNCNPAYLKIMGFKTKKEALNYDLTNLYCDKHTREHIVSKLKKNKKIVNFKYEMFRLDGSKINLVANIFGMYNQQNELEQIHGYMYDITEHNKAQNKIRQLSKAMEQSPAAIIITDKAGRIEYVNAKFTEFTGYTEEDVAGRTPAVLKSGHTSPAEYELLWQTIRKGRQWTGEFYNKRKDGTTYWESAMISPLRNSKGTITHFLAIKEDITERKKMEKELVLAKEKAEESDRLKTAFLNTMSHELRTPLNAIIGFSGLIDEQTSTKDLLTYIEYINHSGDHLLKIIESVFQFSNIEAGIEKIDRSEIRISELFSYLESLFIKEQNLRNKMHIHFSINKIQESLTIQSDPDKISQILTNLLTNALKYTERGSIELGCKTENETDIVFYVKDTGIGIPDHMLNTVFEHFRKVNETASIPTQHDGIGLGLSISKKLAELMGGRLWVQSQIEGGSTFFLKYPNVVEN
ncbi:MAG: PAS domain S-box protein [Bacteroidales bacterium]|nr:PAS domain S-box protein [Bacteroidales bacterium]